MYRSGVRTSFPPATESLVDELHATRGFRRVEIRDSDHDEHGNELSEACADTLQGAIEPD